MLPFAKLKLPAQWLGDIGVHSIAVLSFSNAVMLMCSIAASSSAAVYSF